MNYKRILKSRAIRITILNMLRFIPDTIMLKLQYRIKLNRSLNLNNPKRFTEKIQWYKMHYRNPIMHQCVDKYNVRNYVKLKGLEGILVHLYAHYSNIDSVEWEVLPPKFVMKTQNGGGGLNVFICEDKSKIDYKQIKNILQCKKKKTRQGGREWAYYHSDPGIVVEELLVNKDKPAAGINDYKFFCYNGKAKYIVVDIDRYIGHKRNFYDREWNNLHILSDCPASDREIEKPSNLEEMIAVAERLSDDFPFVRVDLYSVDSKVFFGELTFYPWSGYVQFYPDEWDYRFGEDFEMTCVKS